MTAAVIPPRELAPDRRVQVRLGDRIAARIERVANAAVSPLVSPDYLDLFHPLRSGTDLRARIVSVHPETRDAATIVLKPGRDWAGHLPGQYVRIGIDVDGVRQWRAYSLTHGPRPDGHISITVKAVPDGVVSNHLVHQVRPGTLVFLEQAQGEFVLPDDLAGRKLLFITAGSGVTPVIGMLRNLFPVTDEGVVHLDRALDIVCVHVAPSRPDSIFLRNLEELDAFGAVRLVARYDDQHGVLDVDRLADLVPDLAERTTYACGPAGLLDALAAHHEANGLELFTEQFRATTVVVGDGGTVSFNSGTTIEADAATPILDAAEEAGVLMPSGCRMGICFGCVLPLKEGAVRDLRSGDLIVANAGESDGIQIQTCISAAAGACVIDH
ncbi:Ferredoxin-NADP reductase [Nocardioides terrae]|uniref:Ferredoxin-NADP reductase n=1 Tax=Nocardioides terrae TaxID=574651 RepID=A0A1I1EUU0_9ACTN|nr:ferredoxin reductase [Nocardioides terrae]SFB90929.1 Ferredoxin-NADP reductase [Nocardioides terrae]